MSFVLRRCLINDLLVRHGHILSAHHELTAITVDYDRGAHARFLEAQRDSYRSEDDDEDDEDASLRETMSAHISQPAKLFDIPMLTSVTADMRVARSIGHHLDAIAKLASVTVKTVKGDSNMVEPDLTGWSTDEIRAASGMLSRRINALTFALREIRTHCSYLDVENVYRTRPPSLFEKGGSSRESVLTREFLTGPLNAAVAERAVELLDNIRQTSSPLPGEPPAMTYFGSHVSNRYSVSLPTVAGMGPDTTEGLEA
jgi:hypothetical protein